MFPIGSRVRVTASSINGPGPRRNSVGYIADLNPFNAGQLGTHLVPYIPFPYYYTTTRIMFTRFGQEQRRRVERKRVCLLFMPANTIPDWPKSVENPIKKLERDFERDSHTLKEIGKAILGKFSKVPILMVEPYNFPESLKVLPEEFEAYITVALKQTFYMHGIMKRYGTPGIRSYSHPELLNPIINYSSMPKKRHELFEWAKESPEHRLGLMLTVRQIMGLWNKKEARSQLVKFDTFMKGGKLGSRTGPMGSKQIRVLNRVLCSVAFWPGQLESFEHLANGWAMKPTMSHHIRAFRKSINTSS